MTDWNGGPRPTDDDADDGMGDMPDFASAPPAEGFATLAEFETEVQRLAQLPEHEFERVRQGEAKRLKVRTSFLTKAVERARPRGEVTDQLAGRAVELTAPAPWDAPVDGAELLTDLVGQIGRFVYAPPAARLALALWALHVHAWPAWWISPKLLLRSATRRCGKSRTFEVLERLVARPLLVSAVTASAIFRVIEGAGDAPPCLLADEADRLTENDDNLRRLINAGHTRSTAKVLLSVPDGEGGWTPREFSCWAPLALAGIGSQADTVLDRSVIVTMRRKPVQHQVEHLRGNRDHGFHELARKCARWAQDHLEVLAEADPAPVAGLHDRAQDNWAPLLAVADACGVPWPKKARAAALALLQAAEEQDEAETVVQLIHDIVGVFDREPTATQEPVTRMTTAVLLIRLHDLEERAWGTYGRAGLPLSGHQLARLLREFGIRSHQMKIEFEGKVVNRRGFERDQFVSILAQYPFEPATSLPVADSLGDSVTEPATTDPKVAASVTPNPAASLDGSEVAGPSGLDGEIDTISASETLCLTCGKLLPAYSKSGRAYCSEACRQRAWRSTETVQGGNGRAVAVGDMVLWRTAGGVVQFAAPRRVRALSDDGVWAFVTSSATGLPTGELEVVAPAADSEPGLGERVRAARLARGWSQRELAAAAGSHQPVISKLEAGRSIPADVAARVLDALGIT